MRLPVPLWIDNAEVVSSIQFPVTNASSGQVVHTAYGASPEIAIAAVDSAQKAFLNWTKTTPWERRELFLAAARDLLLRKDEVAALLRQETPIDDFMLEVINIGNTIELLEELAAQITYATNGIIPHTKDKNTIALVIKEPYGVQLGIAPWNASLFLAARSVLTPIACGNTAVLKASELSPRVHHFIGELLKTAGFPPGVLNIVQHRREDAPAILEALISHPAVRKVNFTGSTAVGKIIGAMASSHCKPTLMELGGKAPQIVFEDADLDKAARAAVIAAYAHHGQVCMSTETVIAHESIIDALVSKMDAIAVTLPHGAAASVAQAKKTEGLIRDALDRGAVLASGKLERNGAQLHPTVLVNVNKSMRLWSEESFGPTVGVVSFSTDGEAVDMANDRDYGLAASVFTQNIPRAISVAKQIQSGAVHINSMTIHDEVQLPHGGVKSSGHGRFGVPWAFDEFLQMKTITITDDTLHI